MKLSSDSDPGPPLGISGIRGVSPRSDLNRNEGFTGYFDAFSSREPVPASHRARGRLSLASALVGVAGGQVARNLRAFLDIAADRDGGGRRAGPVGLLEAIIAAVETCDHAGAAIARGGFGIDQRLHFITPFGTFIGAANAPQVVQGAEDLGQPLQVGIEWRGRVLGPRGPQMASRNDEKHGQKML